MERHKLLDKIEEITEKNYKTFRGTNEADLHIREEIADLIEQEKKDEVIRFLEWMAKRGGSAFVCTYDEIYNDFKEATK